MKVIVIGGGASGVMHALYLKRLNPNIEVTILEKNDRILKKLMKTGNGRCNISNSDMQAKYYNKVEFVEKLYNDIKPNEVLDYFKSIGLLVKNDNSTRLYPYSESAKTVIDALRYELENSGVEVRCNEEVVEIKKNKQFRVSTTSNSYTSDYLVIASGSIAQEETNIYGIVEKLGHKTTSLSPGLVALKVKEDLKSIQGIRVKCNTRVINKGRIVHEEEGEVLFKEKGLSGVVILNQSRFVQDNSIVSLDLFNDYPNIENYIYGFIKHKNILDILSNILPKMLAIYIVKLANEDINKVIKLIRDLRFNVVGNYGYTQGQIVLGGVELASINNDFSSKLVEGLYLIGEVIDIDGASGGYNLHFAWTSGIMSAKSIFEKNL